jgi:hypothetical protein
MPRAPIKRDKLHDRAKAIDEEMGGHTHACEICKRGMRRNIKAIRQERLGQTGAEFARWQADAMNDDQLDTFAHTTRVNIG